MATPALIRQTAVQDALTDMTDEASLNESLAAKTADMQQADEQAWLGSDSLADPRAEEERSAELDIGKVTTVRNPEHRDHIPRNLEWNNDPDAPGYGMTGKEEFELEQRRRKDARPGGPTIYTDSYAEARIAMGNRREGQGIVAIPDREGQRQRNKERLAARRQGEDDVPPPPPPTDDNTVGTVTADEGAQIANDRAKKTLQSQGQAREEETGVPRVSIGIVSKLRDGMSQAGLSFKKRNKLLDTFKKVASGQAVTRQELRDYKRALSYGPRDKSARQDVGEFTAGVQQNIQDAQLNAMEEVNELLASKEFLSASNEEKVAMYDSIRSKGSGLERSVRGMVMDDNIPDAITTASEQIAQRKEAAIAALATEEARVEAKRKEAEGYRIEAAKRNEVAFSEWLGGNVSYDKLGSMANIITLSQQVEADDEKSQEALDLYRRFEADMAEQGKVHWSSTEDGYRLREARIDAKTGEIIDLSGDKYGLPGANISLPADEANAFGVANSDQSVASWASANPDFKFDPPKQGEQGIALSEQAGFKAGLLKGANEKLAEGGYSDPVEALRAVASEMSEGTGISADTILGIVGDGALEGLIKGSIGRIKAAQAEDIKKTDEFFSKNFLGDKADQIFNAESFNDTVQDVVDWFSLDVDQKTGVINFDKNSTELYAYAEQIITRVMEGNDLTSPPSEGVMQRLRDEISGKLAEKAKERVDSTFAEHNTAVQEANGVMAQANINANFKPDAITVDGKARGFIVNKNLKLDADDMNTLSEMHKWKDAKAGTPENAFWNALKESRFFGHNFKIQNDMLVVNGDVSDFAAEQSIVNPETGLKVVVRPKLPTKMPDSPAWRDLDPTAQKEIMKSWIRLGGMEQSRTVNLPSGPGTISNLGTSMRYAIEGDVEGFVAATGFGVNEQKEFLAKWNAMPLIPSDLKKTVSVRDGKESVRYEISVEGRELAQKLGFDGGGYVADALQRHLKDPEVVGMFEAGHFQNGVMIALSKHVSDATMNQATKISTALAPKMALANNIPGLSIAPSGRMRFDPAKIEPTASPAQMAEYWDVLTDMEETLEAAVDKSRSSRRGDTDGPLTKVLRQTGAKSDVATNLPGQLAEVKKEFLRAIALNEDVEKNGFIYALADGGITSNAADAGEITREEVVDLIEKNIRNYMFVEFDSDEERRDAAERVLKQRENEYYRTVIANGGNLDAETGRY
jgi:hypothetical protein